jgi:hypothetical protein
MRSGEAFDTCERVAQGVTIAQSPRRKIENDAALAAKIPDTVGAAIPIERIRTVTANEDVVPAIADERIVWLLPSTISMFVNTSPAAAPAWVMLAVAPKKLYVAPNIFERKRVHLVQAVY